MFKKWSSKIYLLGIALFTLSALVVASRPTVGAQFLTSPLPSPPRLATNPFDSPLPPSMFEAQAHIALQYIAKREGVPLEDLLVVHQHRREYPLLGRRFMAFTIFDQTAHRDFHLLIDLNDGSVVDDVAAMERTETEARRARYSKLHPLLYERFQTADDKEVLPVAIWIGGERGRSREEVYAILSDRYPKVQDALARHASPFDVGDPALALQIRDEYERMRQENIAARIQPLVTDLESRGLVQPGRSLSPDSVAV